MATADDYRETWYEDAMTSRELALASVFGPSSPAGQVFKPEDEDLEVRVPGFAFLRYPPTTHRPYWLYVTHGLAQPAAFEDFCDGFAGEASGWGFEFALATAAEETWPFAMLEHLTDYFLNAQRAVYPGDRIPASDLMEEESGGGLMALPTPPFAEVQTLCGKFEIIQLVGITAGELEKAMTYPGRVGSRILELVLGDISIVGITDRKRACTMKRPGAERIWQEKSLKVDAKE